MPFEDKTIVCSDCGAEFIHSAEDQARYAERGFTNEPKRCRTCREKQRGTKGGSHAPRQGGSSGGGPRSTGGGDAARGPREAFEVVCAECGARTTVPFKPSGDRPVYCRDCFRAKRR